MKTAYMHTIDGKPGVWNGSSIDMVLDGNVGLVPTLKEAQAQQTLAIASDTAAGVYPAEGGLYEVLRVTLPA